MDHHQEVWQNIFPLPLPDSREQLITRLTGALTRGNREEIRSVFGTIVLQFSGTSRRVALGLCNNTHDAEDLVAETNYRIYDLLRRQPAQSNGKPRFESWQNWENFYCRAMKNLWISRWHARRNEHALGEAERAETDKGLERVDKQLEVSSIFQEHLQALSRNELKILEATVRTSQEEAAAELGCTINNIYTTMNRIRKKADAVGLSGPVVANALDLKIILERIHEEQRRRHDGDKLKTAKILTPA